LYFSNMISKSMSSKVSATSTALLVMKFQFESLGPGPQVP